MSADAVAVIGLGLMGSRMARRLAGHGFELHGYDPDPDRVREFESQGGHVTASPAEAVSGCWAALLSLPNSEVSKEVCLDPGGLSGSGVTPLHVYDATTGRPGDAVEIGFSLADAGIVYSDATVSGNGEIAERGELVVMVGGPPDAFERGIPIFEAIGRSHHHVGELGAGSRMKLLVNHALTIHRMALAETLVVAEMAGLDLDATIAVLKDGLSYSKAMDAWGDRMIAGDHEDPFARLRQSSKDARLIVEHGRDLGAPIHLVEIVAAALAEGETTGLGDLDNSSIVEVVRRRAGIGRVE
jgi:3-hydroxyisobutyrate dehydrogenase-like beta-hydroxyacid dehydrogenase